MRSKLFLVCAGCWAAMTWGAAVDPVQGQRVAPGRNAATGTLAEGFPSRPVRLVVPFPPGGGTDLVARMLSEKLGESFRQPLVVDNRPGAAGTLGAHLVARAPSDGYTLLLATGSFAIAAGAYDKLGYDAVKDFSAIGLVASQPLVLVTHPSVPVASIADLIALARAKPATLNYASGGAGGINHLAGELFTRASAIQMTHVAYRGAGPALTALLSGEAQLMIATLGSCLGQIQAGKLRAIALTRTRRAAALPEIPTMHEAGVAGYEVDNWYGIIAPRGLAPSIAERINRDIVAAVRSADVQRRFAAQAFEPASSTPVELAAYIRAEVDKWIRVSKAAGIQLQ